MTSESIPEEVRGFLLEHIETYEQLEVLLLLRKQPERSASADDLARAARLPPAAVEGALEALHALGLAVASANGVDPLWRYAAARPDTGRTVERLAQAYEESAIDIVKVMNANAIERVRSSARRAFAIAGVAERHRRR